MPYPVFDGRLEYSLELPKTTPTAVALICHPNPVQGGTMDNKVVTTTAKALLECGHVVLRFNYRGVGQSLGEYGHAIGETDDAETMLRFLQAQFPHLPLTLAGFSFGTFVVTHLSARLPELPTHLILIGAAVDRFGDASKTYQLPRKTLMIHGEQDEVVPLGETLAWAGRHAQAVLTLPACSHFFHGKLHILKNAIINFVQNPHALV
jgi:alpha/beta superfamily hydrolase